MKNLFWFLWGLWITGYLGGFFAEHFKNGWSWVALGLSVVGFAALMVTTRIYVENRR